MVPALRLQTDAGAVGEPEAPSFGLLGRHLEAFGPPDALHALRACLPTGHLVHHLRYLVTLAEEDLGLTKLGDDLLGGSASGTGSASYLFDPKPCLKVDRFQG